MCGRYSATKRAKIELERAELQAELAEFRPSYNVCPTQQMPVYVQEDGKVFERQYRWGIVPPWRGKKYDISNMRSDKIKTNPFYRKLIAAQRCLVPASGFFEWETTAQGKMPWHFFVKGADTFCFAGLWHEWATDTKNIQGFSLITTEPNSLLGRIHDRMPVILAPEHYEDWLSVRDHEHAEDLLISYPSEKMDGFPVSRLVNSVKNNSPECVKPL